MSRGDSLRRHILLCLLHNAYSYELIVFIFDTNDLYHTIAWMSGNLINSLIHMGITRYLWIKTHSYITEYSDTFIE